MTINVPTEYGMFVMKLEEAKDWALEVAGEAAGEIDACAIERSTPDSGIKIEINNHSNRWVQIRYQTAQIWCGAWTRKQVRPNRITTWEIPAHQIGVCDPIEASYAKEHASIIEWQSTELKGIFFRWGGQFSNLLYFKNEKSEWARIEYNDGERWRPALLPPNSDNNCETLADYTDNLLVRWRDRLS